MANLGGKLLILIGNNPWPIFHYGRQDVWCVEIALERHGDETFGRVESTMLMGSSRYITMVNSELAGEGLLVQQLQYESIYETSSCYLTPQEDESFVGFLVNKYTRSEAKRSTTFSKTKAFCISFASD
ncbi:hypothetical protein YC2023_054019 [Brassica napus]